MKITSLLEGADYNFDQGNTIAQQGWSAHGLASLGVQIPE